MNKQYRADLPAWIFIGGLSCFPWLVVWASHSTKAASLLVPVVVSALGFVWLFSFRIVLTPTEVRFRTLFGGQQSIRHDQIERVRLTWSLQQRARGPLRLVIQPRDGTGVQGLNINAKVFSKVAIDAVLALGARLAEADDGGLRDGVVSRTLREWKQHRRK